MEPNDFSDIMVAAGVEQIAEEGRHVNKVLGAIANAFLEVPGSVVLEPVAEGSFKQSDVISVCVWESGDGREWAILLAGDGTLTGIHLYHKAAPVFDFRYDLFDHEDFDEDDYIFALMPREIAAVRRHVDLLLQGTLNRFPCLLEPMSVYFEAARRAGAF